MKVSDFFGNKYTTRTQDEIIDYLKEVDELYLKSIDITELKDIETLILDLYKTTSLSQDDISIIDSLLDIKKLW